MSAHTDEKPFVWTECYNLSDASKQVVSQTNTTSHKHESILHLTNYYNTMMLAPMASVTKSLLKLKNTTIPQCKVLVSKCFLPTNNQFSVNNSVAITIDHATNLTIILYKSIINYCHEPPLVTKCHIPIRKILPSTSSRHLCKLKITMSALKTVYHTSVVVYVKYIVLLLVLVIIKYLTIVYTTHIVYRVYDTSAIKTIYQIILCTNPYVWHNSALCAIVTVYKMCVLVIVKCVHIPHTASICLYQMHISLNLIYVNIVAKNNIKFYLLHESLSILVFELCPSEDLLARYHTNGEIICRELASKTKKSHLIKLPKYIAFNIITSYIPNIKTLNPL